MGRDTNAGRAGRGGKVDVVVVAEEVAAEVPMGPCLGRHLK
jgi:hypothetical protein